MADKFIVSANYRKDRDENSRWLVREIGDPVDKAETARAVHANVIFFRQSSAEEAGFGCSVVAYCKDVICNNLTPGGRHLQAVDFNGFDFILRFTGEIISSCQELVLEPNGFMFIVPNEEPAAHLPCVDEVSFSHEF